MCEKEREREFKESVHLDDNDDDNDDDKIVGVLVFLTF